MNKAPIHVWREQIDDSTYAVVAIVEFVFRGGYHMATAWTMVPANDYRWRQAGDAVLREHILKEHGGHVPYIRRARDEGARTFRGDRPAAGDQ